MYICIYMVIHIHDGHVPTYHLRVTNARPRRHPLGISVPESALAPHGIVVVHEALVGDGDGLKATVGVLRESGDRGPVVHVPVLIAKVGADIAIVEGGVDRHIGLAFRVGVVVEHREEERGLCVGRGEGGEGVKGRERWGWVGGGGLGFAKLPSKIYAVKGDTHLGGHGHRKGPDGPNEGGRHRERK